MKSEVPVVYVKEDGKVIAKEAPIIERQCWWCKNLVMYEVKKAGMFTEEIVWYQCPSCGAREDQYGLTFISGRGERK